MVLAYILKRGKGTTSTGFLAGGKGGEKEVFPPSALEGQGRGSTAEKKKTSPQVEFSRRRGKKGERSFLDLERRKKPLVPPPWLEGKTVPLCSKEGKKKGYVIASGEKKGKNGAGQPGGAGAFNVDSRKKPSCCA